MPILPRSGKSRVVPPALLAPRMTSCASVSANVRAGASLQAVFHPSYVAVHRDAALLLGDKRTIVFRGDGGENERRPNKALETVLVADGVVERYR